MGTRRDGNGTLRLDDIADVPFSADRRRLLQMKTVILDTNVLLADPNIVLSYPGQDVVIPEVVLSELDKLKISRTDADVRFRGREVSRLLFELSEDGSLLEGVELPDGGTLRVAPFSQDMALPEGLSARNTDDRILASAYAIFSEAGKDDSVVLVTNDLNMLLKAQTLGMPFERAGDGTDDDWAKKYIVRPFQRYRVPLTILMIAIAVFFGVLVIALSMNGGAGSGTGSTLPDGYKSVLTDSQQDALDALRALERNPKNTEMLLQLANFYYGRYEETVHDDPATAISHAQQGIRYYRRYLDEMPTSVDPRVDMAALELYTGQTDIAIQEIGKALELAPGHVQANYNLGVIYLQGRGDLEKAAAQFQKVIDLTTGDSKNQPVNQSAAAMLAQIQKQMQGGTEGEIVQ